MIGACAGAVQVKAGNRITVSNMIRSAELLSPSSHEFTASSYPANSTLGGACYRIRDDDNNLIDTSTTLTGLTVRWRLLVYNANVDPVCQHF